MASWTEGLHREGNLTIERLAIRSPVWNGRKVGIAAFRARRSDIIEVKVLYRIKSGKPLLSKVLTMASSKVLDYPRQWVTSAMELCLVPIADFQEKKP